MKKAVLWLFVFSLVFSLSGCATLFKKETFGNVPVRSEPAGAEIFINGVSYGVTPTTIRLEDGKDYNIVLKLNGETRNYTIRSEIGILWLVLDLFGSSGLGLIVDAATGDWYEIPEDEVYVIF